MLTHVFIWIHFITGYKLKKYMQDVDPLDVDQDDRYVCGKSGSIFLLSLLKEHSRIACKFVDYSYFVIGYNVTMMVRFINGIANSVKNVLGNIVLGNISDDCWWPDDFFRYMQWPVVTRWFFRLYPKTALTGYANDLSVWIGTKKCLHRRGLAGLPRNAGPCLRGCFS